MDDKWTLKRKQIFWRTLQWYQPDIASSFKVLVPLGSPRLMLCSWFGNMHWNQTQHSHDVLQVFKVCFTLRISFCQWGYWDMDSVTCLRHTQVRGWLGGCPAGRKQGSTLSASPCALPCDTCLLSIGITRVGFSMMLSCRYVQAGAGPGTPVCTVTILPSHQHPFYISTTPKIQGLCMTREPVSGKISLAWHPEQKTPGLLWQISTNLVAHKSRHLFAHSSGSQKCETEVLTGPPCPWKLQGRILSLLLSASWGCWYPL